MAPTLPVDVFRSRKDAWLVAVLAVAAIGDCIAAVVLTIVGPPSALLSVVVPVVLAGAAIVIIWSLLGTSYRVRGEELLIRCGPFRSRVPIGKIETVAPTHSPVAAPALSLDRLELRPADPSRTVLLSPAEPARFIASLKAVKPAITETSRV